MIIPIKRMLLESGLPGTDKKYNYPIYPTTTRPTNNNKGDTGENKPGSKNNPNISPNTSENQKLDPNTKDYMAKVFGQK